VIYEKNEQHGNGRRNGNGVGGGSHRQSLGAGNSLGEKIAEAIETAAYKGVVQPILARSLAALHGVNIMKHSDIRLFALSKSIVIIIIIVHHHNDTQLAA